MRHWLTCLLLIGCGGAADSAGGGGAGSPARTDAGSGGSSGRTTAAEGGGRAGAGSGAGGSAVYGGGGGGATATAGRSGANSNAGAGGHTAVIPSLRIVPNVIAGTQMSTTGQNIGSSAFSQRVGTVSGTSLHSLKYYVQSIQLCEHVTVMGTGFSNTSGCVMLYENQGANSPDYTHYMVTEALADNTPGRYIDLMTTEGQGALRQPRMVQLFPRPEPNPSQTDADAGVEDVPGALAVFRYGLINFYRPIKVTADFPILGETGAYFRTKAVTMTHRTEPTANSIGSERVEIGDTLNGATEETTYMLNNGGALFTFQQPFVITQADVDAKKEVKIDLVFNPENFGQAYEVQCQGMEWVSICDPVNGVGIDMPFVRMSPVPRKQGEHTRKETYLMDYDLNAKVRIELYYNDADPEAGVQGVDTAIVYTAAPDLYTNNVVASNFVSQSGSVQTNDAVLSLKDYRNLNSVTGLRRRQSGTASLHCLFVGAVCPTMGGEVSKAYTYEGDTVVSSD